MNDEAVRTRVIGLGLICVGLILFFVDYNMRHYGGSYYPMMTFLSPLMIALGLDFVIETPKLPMEKPSPFGWLCIIGGSLIGIWNAVF